MSNKATENLPLVNALIFLIIHGNKSFKFPNLSDMDKLKKIATMVHQSASTFIEDLSAAELGIIASGLKNESGNVVNLYNRSMGYYSTWFKKFFEQEGLMYALYDPQNIGTEFLKKLAAMHLAAETMEAIGHKIREAGKEKTHLPYGYETY